jgi:replication-associated recombination protein RarA
MDDLLLHPRTKAELTALLHDAPHALLFVAPAGFGKLTIARTWAQNIAKNAAISVLEPDEKGTITIEATRTLYQRTRAKQDGWQVVIIDHAESMSPEAQNAFLKLLEEPRPNLTFIMTSPSTDVLLQTILSRLQVVTLLPVSAQTLMAHAKQLTPDIDAQTLQQQLFVANGRPAALVTMQQNPDSFDAYRQVMQRAKQLMSANIYERLVTVPELSKDREQAVATLEAMAHMLELQIKRDPSPKLIKLADNLQNCLARLRQNGNVRAQLTSLFMVY